MITVMVGADTVTAVSAAAAAAEDHDQQNNDPQAPTSVVIRPHLHSPHF